MTTKESRFDWMELDSETNIPDLQKWVNDNELVGLIDETKCGIIGYINHVHIEEIVSILNQKERLIEANELLSLSLYVLNLIPNKKLKIDGIEDTYEIASLIHKYFEK